MTHDLNARTRQILKLVVDSYVETGEPVGSRVISEKMGLSLSPATVRHAMAELEARGLLYAPHTSAGRLPTDNGLAVFVDGLLEIDTLSPAERQHIKTTIAPAAATSRTQALERTSEMLSGLAGCAGLVFAPTDEDAIKQIEFVLLAPGRALAILVTSSGSVENRIITVAPDVTATTLMRAANYLNAHIADKTLGEAADIIARDMAQARAQLDELTARVISSGLASLAPADHGGHLFVKGQSRLLDDVSALADLERIRSLFAALETKDTMQRVLKATAAGEGVKIFIGADNSLFSHAGCSLIVAPYSNGDSRIVGALGVIGPTRLNYRRIIPVINYTSQLVGQILR